MDNVRIFISYSKEDFDLMKGVETIISRIDKIEYFSQYYGIEIWSDQYIIAGEDWKSKIFEYIDEADVIIFLLSDNFINSPFIQKYEVPRAIERQKEDGIKIMGVYLEECNYKKSYIKKTQLVPQFKGRLHPIESWNNEDKYWETIVDAVKESAYISINNFPWNRKAPINSPLPSLMKEKKLLRGAPLVLGELHEMAYKTLEEKERKIQGMINDHNRKQNEDFIRPLAIIFFFLLLFFLGLKAFIDS